MNWTDWLIFLPIFSILMLIGSFVTLFKSKKKPLPKNKKTKRSIYHRK